MKVIKTMKQKKIHITFLVVLCLLMTGCNTEYAKKEYNSNEKIASVDDHYTKQVSVFNQIEGGLELKVSKFDGRETLWSDSLKNGQDMDIEFTLTLTKGKAKVVYIDDDKNVTTLIECTPDTSTSDTVTKTVTLKKGQNKLKVVGYDCEDLKLKMMFDEP